MKKEDWEIPSNLQPDPSDYSFDLERALKAVVSLKTYVPADAFTAHTLGTERAGSGVMIRNTGLIATIGYLVTEGDSIRDKKVFPVHVVFPPNVDRLAMNSGDIDLGLPISSEKSGNAYAVIAGFQLTPDELATNRKGGGS